MIYLAPFTYKYLTLLTMKQSKWQEIVKHNRFTKGLQICNFALPFEIHWPLKKLVNYHLFILFDILFYRHFFLWFFISGRYTCFWLLDKKSCTINFEYSIFILSSSHFNFEIPKFTSLLVLKNWWEIQIFDHQRPWSPKSAQ